jgi:Secretion system C-terminal sorting domain
MRGLILIKNLNDSTSSRYIPDQLFVSSIEPKYSDAKLNEKVNFNGSVSSPSVGYSITSTTWVLDSPNSNSNQLVSNGFSASLVPLEAGVYSLSLDVSIVDSEGTNRELQSSPSYAVVPDKFTETFEHNNLTDLFPWKTYGDAQWTITDKEAQTGTYSIQPGNINVNQSSTLEINIDLPSDNAIEFAIKINTSFTDILEFYIDTTAYGTYYDFVSDWNFYTYLMPAGKHVLKWIYRNLGTSSNNGPSVWLDNIFFPTNAVNLTSVKSEDHLPLTFNLFQNYPNPFNPNTLLKYSLASESQVKLSIYDITGRRVKDLFIGEQSAGMHEVNFDGSNLSSGVYLYTIEADSKNGIFKATKKMILLK